MRLRSLFVALSAPCIAHPVAAQCATWQAGFHLPGVEQSSSSTQIRASAAGTSASGCQATISSTGTASRSNASGFAVTVASVEGLPDGVIFFGTAGAQAIPWGIGTSFRCVAPPTVRTGVQDGVGTGGACDNVYALDFNTWMSTHPGSAPKPGDTAYLQAWYRAPDNGSNKAMSFSNALRVLVCP